MATGNLITVQLAGGFEVTMREPTGDDLILWRLANDPRLSPMEQTAVMRCVYDRLEFVGEKRKLTAEEMLDKYFRWEKR